MKKKPANAVSLFNRTDPSPDRRGPAWTVRSNDRAKVITLQRHCRPDRNEAWEKATRREIGDPAFERQYGLNWATPLGEAFYPEAVALGHLHEIAPGEFTGWYVRKATAWLDKAPVLVGLDFGYKRNGCIIAQYDKASGILWFMRELRMEGMVCHEACAVIRYVTGRASLADLKREGHPDALELIASRGLSPWISPDQARRMTFLDYGAKHEKEIQNGLAPSREELSWSKQFGKQGVVVRGIPQNWTHAETVMRHLLRESRHPGIPRMFIDPSCVWWLRGLAGGLVIAPLGQRMGGYKRDEEFEDVADMAHYVAQAVYRSRDLAPLEEADAKARSKQPTRPDVARKSGLANERITPRSVSTGYARPFWNSIDAYDPR